MAATRLIALHKNKGKSVAACLKSRTDYVQNPDKTEHGELISSYECNPLTVDLYHGKVLSSADGEHWLIQFSTKYHLSYMGAVSELLRQLDSLHSYDLLNQYAMKSLTIAPDNPKAYCWLIRSLKAQGMNELATNELAAAKEHLTTEEYEEILAFGANW